MSNSIQIPPYAVVLYRGFMQHKLKPARDLDGNETLRVGNRWVFRPAAYTTWRELRTFIRDNITPAVSVREQVRADVPHVRDEYDGFTQAFTAKLWFNAPEWEKYAQ